MPEVREGIPRRWRWLFWCFCNYRCYHSTYSRQSFFIGDLTGCNFGVVLETGIALALKPNERVLLFTQDGSHSLHFDLQVSNIGEYSETDIEEDSGSLFVKKIAQQMVMAANHFEAETNKYVTFLSAQLTPDGIFALQIYGILWELQRTAGGRPPIWEDNAAKYCPDRFSGNTGKIAFHNAVRELTERRLFWTDFGPEPKEGKHWYGIHATNLGWRVIERLWPKWKQPESAPTGPNLT